MTQKREKHDLLAPAEYKSLDQIFKKSKKMSKKLQKLDLLAPAEYKSLDQIFKNCIINNIIINNISKLQQIINNSPNN